MTHRSEWSQQLTTVLGSEALIPSGSLAGPNNEFPARNWCCHAFDGFWRSAFAFRAFLVSYFGGLGWFSVFHCRHTEPIIGLGTASRLLFLSFWTVFHHWFVHLMRNYRTSQKFFENCLCPVINYFSKALPPAFSDQNLTAVYFCVCGICFSSSFLLIKRPCGCRVEKATCPKSCFSAMFTFCGKFI